jgi:hypothetical protein
MWILAPAVALAIAIAAHSCLCRAELAINSVARFFVAGGIVGVGLSLFLVTEAGFSVETAAGIAAYAAACEIYVFLFTLVSGSISVSLATRLLNGPMSQAEIEASIGGRSMVELRIARMLATGLLVRRADGRFGKTARGALLLWGYRWLRRFFWRPPLIPGIVTLGEPGPLLGAIPPADRHRLALVACDALALLLLACAGLFLFWPHITGNAVFVGDSDRLNHYLSILRFLTDGYRDGHVRTWDELLFGGFDVPSFTFPYPTSLLHLLWPADKLFYAAGVVSCSLLIAAGLFAYLFLRNVVDRPFAAFVGALLYETTSLAVLKVSQNDISFSAYVLFPIVLLLIRRADRHGLGSFAGLSFALAYLAMFAFLQKAAYIMLFAGVYALFRFWKTRAWSGLLAFFAASAVALLAALPRLYQTGEEFVASVRFSPPENFTEVTKATVRFESYEILRWFDDRIFGISAGQAAEQHPYLNVHEGLLFYASTFAALLVLFSLGRHVLMRRRHGPLPDADAGLYIATIAFCFFVVLTKTGYDLMFYAFQRIDFIHARVVIVGMLPYCALVAVFLAALLRSAESPGASGRRSFWIALVVALACLAVSEALAAHFENRFRTIPWPGAAVKMNAGALLRIALSAAIFAVLMTAARRRPQFAAAAFYTLGFLMTGQALLFAKQELTGAHMRTDKAFAEHVRLLAHAGDFQGPSKSSLDALAEKLERERYRTSVICDPKVTAINCSPHVAHFWNLRMVDGYLSAVPARLPLLPWDPAVIGPRTLNFQSPQELPWPLLGMLNVKYALVLNDALMKNHVVAAGGSSRQAALADFRILENGSTVVPRVFFAASAHGVAGAREARQKLFPYASTPALPADVRERSYVEGLDGTLVSSDREGITSAFSGDGIDLSFGKSATPRFLVVNERFHPRWKAWVDGAETRIYPANVFMRGVVVPAGASRVQMRYEPFIYTRAALACYGAALLVFAIVLFGLIRARNKRAAQPSATST